MNPQHVGETFPLLSSQSLLETKPEQKITKIKNVFSDSEITTILLYA